VHRKPQEIYSLEEANDRIYDVFRNHGFGDVPHDQRRLLARFYELLMHNQEHQNFTRLLKIRDVAIKHYIDCLIVPRLTQLTFPLLDVGTGPGFPGIPLKIAFRDEKIILAEGVQKRVEFLKAIRDQLQLPHLDIIGRNVDENFVYPVQGVITRAVEETSLTLKSVINSLQTGGKVFLMKGPNVDQEIVAAERDWSEYYRLDQNITYELPQTPHQRRLLVYTKIKSGPTLNLNHLVEE
jgi:16S rRNA (guanine527-N7)-methyltransferase